jgi:hypothetical protein
LTSRKLAIVSASVDGESIACTLFASSAGACGSSEIASTAFCFRYSVRASTSGCISPVSLRNSTRATRNGKPVTWSSTRKRRSPCATRWCVPSGAVR